MREILLTALIGVVAGVIDILPMIKMKLNKYAISSAFIFYFILPFIILNTDLFRMAWWLKGGVIAPILAIPVIIVVAKEDQKSILPMAVTSIVLGTLIGIAGYYIL
jgi:hypothetical protein